MGQVDLQQVAALRGAFFWARKILLFKARVRRESPHTSLELRAGAQRRILGDTVVPPHP